jgi:hypothetical protein
MPPFLLAASLLGATLTPAQAALLTAPPRHVEAAPFSFAAPAGPTFTDAEKETQRAAGRTVVPLVKTAFAAGVDHVRLAPGDYRFGQETWGPDGPIYPLEFDSLRRDDDHPFLVDAGGCTFWFDLADDEAPTEHFCLGFRDCANLILRGAILDRGTPGCVEGRITAFDFAAHRIEIELSPGMTLPTRFNDDLNQRLVPFKADGTFCAPLYALQSGGRRLRYGPLQPGSRPGRCWVPLLDPALLDTSRDAAWLKRWGERGVLRVGDGLSLVYTVAESIGLRDCRHVTLDGLDVYVTKAGGSEQGGDGGHLWHNCYVGPRPGTSRWQGADGFMFNATRQGPTLDGVTVVHTTDDVLNIHGYWGLVQAVDGRRVTFERNASAGWSVPRGAVAGDRLWFYDPADAKPVGRATVTAIDGHTVTLDAAVAAKAGAVAEWPEHECGEWLIQRCDFHDDYQRVLLQSGPGVLRDCHLTRLGSCVELNSVLFGHCGEGGVPRAITVADNVFTEVAPTPGGASVGVYFRAAHTPAVPLLGGLTITGNTFTAPGGAAVFLDGVDGAVLSGNRFRGVPGDTVAMTRCRNVDIGPNMIEEPGK